MYKVIEEDCTYLVQLGGKRGSLAEFLPADFDNDNNFEIVQNWSEASAILTMTTSAEWSAKCSDVVAGRQPVAKAAVPQLTIEVKEKMAKFADPALDELEASLSFTPTPGQPSETIGDAMDALSGKKENGKVPVNQPAEASFRLSVPVDT